MVIVFNTTSTMEFFSRKSYGDYRDYLIGNYLIDYGTEIELRSWRRFGQQIIDENQFLKASRARIEAKLAESIIKNDVLQKQNDNQQQLFNAFAELEKLTKQPGFVESCQNLLAHLDKFPAFLASVTKAAESKADAKFKEESKTEVKAQTKVEQKPEFKPIVRSPEMDPFDVRHTQYTVETDKN